MRKNYEEHAEMMNTDGKKPMEKTMRHGLVIEESDFLEPFCLWKTCLESQMDKDTIRNYDI